MPIIQMKRIYEPFAATDGFRVLVDRLWPRGIRKDGANIDLWAKDITPTTQLRKDYHSGRDSWPEFESKYHTELWNNPALAPFISTIREKDIVTLLFAGKDTDHTHVTVIMDILKEKLHK